MTEYGAKASLVSETDTLKLNILDKAISVLNNVGVFSRWTNIIAVTIFFLMILLITTDVVLRYVFNLPITGSNEIIEVMLITAVFLALPHTHNEGGHIAIDLVTSKLSTKVRTQVECFRNVLALGLFIIIVWRTLVQTLWFIEQKSMQSQFLSLPRAPFSAIIVFGCALVVFLLLRDILRNISTGMKLGMRGYQWSILLAILCFTIIFTIFWVQPALMKISLPWLGLIGVMIALAFFMTGLPIAFSLILVSLLFISHIRGVDASFNIIGTEVYASTGKFTWAVVGFFVLMGYLCLYAKFGEDLYFAAYRWIGRLPGGLAAATIGGCTAFAAITGEGVSAIATMGSISLPQMKKFNYDTGLSAASVACGGTLGPIIPPSVPFIIYGLTAGLSIGTLFISGIVPGLMLSAAFIAYIYFRCRLNPALGPRGETFTLTEKVKSLKAGGPIIILFLLVIGGMYTGVFTPNEGGAIGAFGAFVLGILYRRFSWKSFSQSLLAAGKVIPLVFLIVIGATMFTRFIAWCKLSATMSTFISGLGLAPPMAATMVLVIFFILGCFIDVLTLLLIGVPTLHPIIVAMGIDPIYFAVLVILIINVGVITPPVGINLFTLKGVAPEIPIGTIYRGVIPFVFATVIVVVVLFLIPPLITWLPGIIHY